MRPVLVTRDNTSAIVRRVRALAQADLAVLAAVAEVYPTNDEALTEALAVLYTVGARRCQAPTE